MTTTTATTGILEHVVDRLRHADYPGLVQRMAPEGVLDMNLPTWRFQLRGAEKVSDYFATQFGQLPTVSCTQFRLHAEANPIIVESESRFDGPDGQYLWRAVDIVHVEDGRIVSLTQYCSGCWDPATIARQAAEAPMIRW